MTSRDVEFYINLYKANRDDNCEYVRGRFPDNVASVAAPNASTLVLHLNASYDPEWFLYKELSQLVPLPLAWDRTSLSQPAPTTDNGHLPDTTTAGAQAVYKFLDAQSKDISTWTTSPLWTVVDGPWKLQSFTTDGRPRSCRTLTIRGRRSPRSRSSSRGRLTSLAETARLSVDLGHPNEADKRR